MRIISSPPEQITAAIDVIFACLTLGMAVTFGRMRKQEIKQPKWWKATIWMWMFGLLATSSVLGACIHGLDISIQFRGLLWQPTELLLGFVLGFFVDGVIYDVFGELDSRKVLPYLIGGGFLYYLLTWGFNGTYRAYLPYGIIAFCLALTGYFWLFFTKKMEGAGLWIAGALITVISSIIESIGQDDQIYIWQLDHNGVSHILELLGIGLIFAALLKSLRSDRKPSPFHK
jgi:hypothetical protein